MMKESITTILSQQVNAEYYSAYLYLAMATDCDRKGLKGFSRWLFLQAQEELSHGTKIYQYILERGGTPTFSDIKVAPKTEWDSLISLFEEVYAHEQKVTEMIHEIASLSMQEKDHSTYSFNQWFINEQVEEEASADEILQTLRYVKEDPASVFHLDRELGVRTLTPEPEVE